MGLDNILALFLLPLFGILSDKTKAPAADGPVHHFRYDCGHRSSRRSLISPTACSTAAYPDVTPTNPTAQDTLYDARPFHHNAGRQTVVLQDAFTGEKFSFQSL
jgi:hypothetical protein